MPKDWGIFGDTMRKIGMHRDLLGADSISEKRPVKVRVGKSAAHKRIDDEIRSRRAARKKAK